MQERVKKPKRAVNLSVDVELLNAARQPGHTFSHYWRRRCKTSFARQNGRLGGWQTGLPLKQAIVSWQTTACGPMRIESGRCCSSRSGG